MDTNKLTDKLIEWVETAAQKVGDFASNEIPPFVHEYLTWKFWEAGVSVAACAAFIIGFICIWAIWWVKHKAKIMKCAYEGEVICFTFGGILLSIISIFIFFHEFAPSAKDMIQIKVAPKVYLIERINDIVKENKS